MMVLLTVSMSTCFVAGMICMGVGVTEVDDLPAARMCMGFGVILMIVSGFGLGMCVDNLL